MLTRLRSYLRGDRYMLMAFLALMLVSLLAVYSASSVLAYQKMHGNTAFYMLRHSVMLLCAGLIMVTTSHLRPRIFAGLAEAMLAGGVVLLVLTMLVGDSVNGSSRWLSLGPVSFQPSEIAKIGLLLFTAKQLAKHYDDPDQAFLPILGATGIVCGIILFENLSTCILIAVSVGLLMFVGRVPLLKLATVALAVAAFVVAVIYFAPAVSHVFPRAKTWNARFERHFAADEQPAAANYQEEQALAAVSTGGLIGKGPGNSYMKNFLPMAFSDFIFSIILEEYGLLGCLVILGAYYVIFSRVRYVAARCKLPFHLYTIVGLGTVVSFQALINMMVGVGIFPVTGQTLPMVSMGGTSNFITGFAFGIMLSVSEETARLSGSPALAGELVEAANEHNA